MRALNMNVDDGNIDLFQDEISTYFKMSNFSLQIFVMDVFVKERNYITTSESSTFLRGEMANGKLCSASVPQTIRAMMDSESGMPMSL